MLKVYRDEDALIRAIKDGDVPARVSSPGWAAAKLGVSRQAIFKAIKVGQVDCWRTRDGSIILVSVDSVNQRAHARAMDHRRQARHA